MDSSRIHCVVSIRCAFIPPNRWTVILQLTLLLLCVDQMSENELQECRLPCLNKNSDCLQDTCCGATTPRSRGKDKGRKDRWGANTGKAVATGSQSAPEQSADVSNTVDVSPGDSVDNTLGEKATEVPDSVTESLQEEVKPQD